MSEDTKPVPRAVYYRSTLDDNFYKVTVVKESKSTLWVSIRKDDLKGTPEKKDSNGIVYHYKDKWRSSPYMEETPELIELFEETKTRNKFNKLVRSLSSVKDIAKMREIIEKVGEL